MVIIYHKLNVEGWMDDRSQFEFEHQKFIDGIVGGAYEYLCQFIIKNSMDNIRRTQCALNCFSLSNNLSKYYIIIIFLVV